MAIGTPVLGTVDAQTAASTSSSPTYPAGISAGDLLVLFGFSGSSSNSTFTTPAGFTQQAQLANTGSTAAPNVYLATRTASGSETGSLSVTHGNVVTTMGIVVIPGADATTPLDIAVVTEDKTVGSTTISFPTQTVVTTGALALYVVSGVSTTITATPPSTQGGWTELYDHSVASTRSGEVAYVAGLASGATGAITAAPGWSGSSKDVGILIFVRPAAGATNFNGTSAVALTDTVTSGGIVGAVAGAALALAVGITSAGVVGTSSGASVNETATVSSAGAVGTSSGSGIPLTATITAGGSVAGSGLSTGATVPLTGAVTSAGQVGTAAGSSIGLTATITAAGSVTSGLSTGSSVPLTNTVTSAGVVGKQTGASLAETATVASAAVVGTSTGAALAETASVTAAGRVGLSTGASVSVVVGVTAAGSVSGALSTDITVAARVISHTIPADDIAHTIAADVRISRVASTIARTVPARAISRTQEVT